MSEPAAADSGDSAAPRPPGPIAEPRWPMATAVLTAVALQVVVPHRGRVPGWWVFPILEVVMLVVLIIRDPGRIDRRSEALRLLTILLIAVMTASNMFAAFALVYDILATVPGITWSVLLGRGAAIWFTNVIVFSLWYWELDRGGPAERAARSSVRPSFFFPEHATPELVPVGWTPGYPDYLLDRGIAERHGAWLAGSRHERPALTTVVVAGGWVRL